MGVVLLFLLTSCIRWIGSLAESAGDTPDGTAPEPACPSRVEALIPGGGEAVLVDAFETEAHRIMLCEASDGQVYYHGELIDATEDPILLPADDTGDGYIAWNATYSYEITDDVVIVSNNGSELGRYDLVPWEDPA
ncbi:hypothetical protein [Nocardiopsis sp. CC223A]|uniref:hypothetical protein n=1 Tax=Nocardiopsis sp. CC223A TaxID=3044051 RepID=UPI00278BE515|nr:hypothetical protein [Nocardiopsis sp. CC223A]